eukprot:TRINITY_DN48487_c0_g1_i1.p1 TRINITY_DN48487_c0_g1~~TRINITY_DN48487_c0_g1_i1.p1  ORF type:complete len:122 (-),score=3.72 TRINITY_DN48487_c0_g1_i1:139-504(-)
MCFLHPPSSITATMPSFFISLINLSSSNTLYEGNYTSISDGVTLSSTTSRKGFLGFFFNKDFLSFEVAGTHSYAFTIQSLTNPPLTTQWKKLTRTQQTAIILAVLRFLVLIPQPLTHPLII